MTPTTGNTTAVSPEATAYGVTIGDQLIPSSFDTAMLELRGGR